MSWLKRKWRSVSFRAGLGAAMIVGLIVALGLFILSAAVFISLFVSGSLVQISLMDRIEDQLKVGVAPEDLQVDGASELFLDEGFWAVTTGIGEQGSAAITTGGDFDQRVLDSSFDELNLGIGLEDSRDFDRTGTKTVDGNQWLVIEDAVEVDGSSYTVITGARGEYSLRSFTRGGLPFLIPVLLIVMAVAGLITSWFTRRALGSVEKMRLEVEQITRESLDRRVPTTGARDRVDKLAETMNDMLERLQSSTMQQNQFLADASHELRSPVAGLLAQLDVAAAYPDRADIATLIPKLRAESQRLQLVLDDLLFLGRSEAERSLQPGPPTRVAVDSLLSAEVEHQQLMQPALAVERDGSTDVAVAGNERDLQRAIRNLADNAARHARERVVLGVSADEATVTITVADDGEGISSDDGDKIFDRFVRLDESRARDAGGSGLGLAIVREIVEAHGGTVELVDGDRQGAMFAIRLPLIETTSAD